MLLFNRRVAGASHHRTEARIRRDGFDHVDPQVLRSGVMAAGPPGAERTMSPGDVVVFDTARPQRTRPRAAGVSVAYALGISLFGSTAQPAATALLALSGDARSPAWLLVGAGTMGAAAALAVSRPDAA